VISTEARAATPRLTVKRALPICLAAMTQRLPQNRNGRKTRRRFDPFGARLEHLGPWVILGRDPLGKRALAKCSGCGAVHEISIVDGVPSCGCNARRSAGAESFSEAVVAAEAFVALGRAGTWAAVLASQPLAHVLGVTATPERLDGRGLGEQSDEMIIGPSTATLVEARYLSGFVVYEPTAAPDLYGARIRGGDYATEDLRQAMSGGVIGSAVDEYRHLSPGVPAVAFCVDVEHSRAVAARFCSSGVKAAHVDGETPASERRSAIAGLGNGDLQVITNCGLISEGVDVPAIGAALFLCPTASLGLYLQEVGRALRPHRERIARSFWISPATSLATASPRPAAPGAWTPSLGGSVSAQRARAFAAARPARRSIVRQLIPAPNAGRTSALQKSASRLRCACARSSSASSRRDTCS
jgi:Helicase conserved C-terminal domain